MSVCLSAQYRFMCGEDRCFVSVCPVQVVCVERRDAVFLSVCVSVQYIWHVWRGETLCVCLSVCPVQVVCVERGDAVSLSVCPVQVLCVKSGDAVCLSVCPVQLVCVERVDGVCLSVCLSSTCGMCGEER